MKPAAALLIDGSNFYHALKKDGRLPFGPAGFGALFGKLAERFELKSILFYDALKDRIRDPDGYARQQKFHAGLRKLGLPLEIRARKLKYVTNLTPEQVREKGHEIGIVDACKEKLWSLLLALGVVRWTQEKGIDVMLAVDAIEAARCGKFGTILLLSGDADFVPAVHLIQSLAVQVVNLHPYHGSSTELRMACWQHILIDFDELGPLLR